MAEQFGEINFHFQIDFSQQFQLISIAFAIAINQEHYCKNQYFTAQMFIAIISISEDL